MIYQNLDGDYMVTKWPELIAYFTIFIYLLKLKLIERKIYKCFCSLLRLLTVYFCYKNQMRA